MRRFTDLPYPPTVNTYWRHVGHKTLLSAKAREYLRTANWLIQEQTVPGTSPYQGRVAVEIDLTMPDKRKRDIDNVGKVVCDLLAHAGVYVDDSQIDRLTIRRGPVEPPGGLTVTVTAL